MGKLFLHEAIGVILLSKENRTATVSFPDFSANQN
jgi:hypothetical protein